MKALSIRQPWAWLIVSGIKDVENRNWKTNYRGKLIIHSSKLWDQEGYEFVMDTVEYRQRPFIPKKEGYVFGALIGMVDMFDCVQERPSKWFFGPWGFVFRAPEIWQNPIPYRGQLGLFNVPDEMIEAVT